MTALRKTEGWFTPDEYLELERDAETKSDYLNGYIVEMAGATYEHNVITRNLAGLFFNRLRKTCQHFTSDMKVRIEKANCFRYPDISALCGPINFFSDAKTAYENPQLIIEVLSDSTARIDRNEKFAEYRFLPSLDEYLLIDPSRIRAELFQKGENGRWSSQRYDDLADSLELSSLRCSLALSEVYEDLDLGTA